MKTDLKNKVVIITGSAGGLGKALAAEFYKQGCHLALLDTDTAGLEKTKLEIDRGTQKITLHICDVSDEQNIISVREDILLNHTTIDILVNNAGISISQSFEKMDLEDYKNIMNVNFWGTVYCTHCFLPDLKKQKESHLVNIISDFAFMGFPGKTAYGSSKSAIMGFTGSLKTELYESGVKVSLVVPPPLDTGLVKNNKHIDSEKRELEAKFLEKRGLPLDKTARKIVRRIRKGKYRIIIGAMMQCIDIIARFFPTLLNRILAKNKKRIDFV